MRVESYLWKYVRQNGIAADKVAMETGIDLEAMIGEGKELVTDEFLELCAYLGITPDEVSDQIL